MSKNGKTKRASNTQRIESLPILEPHAAGIDVGSKQHWVCAPTQDGTSREVVAFGATTAELQDLAAWLKARDVASVALESTGVYWIAVAEVLEEQGLEVWLVDTRQLAQVPGRNIKTDPIDCQWIQRLHSYGLLRGAFRPTEVIAQLRTLVRDKAILVAESADWMRRMQKSLDQMNVRVHRAVSDIDGTTGMAIVRAIVQGDRDPENLAKLRDYRCQKTEAQIARELQGHWRADHLFSLQQALKMYDSIAERIAAYDQEIQRQLAHMTPPERSDQTAPPLANANKVRGIKRRGEEQMRQALYRVSGVDATQIDGVGVQTVETVISEYGTDLSQFPTEKHFISHITLAPHMAKSGGKPLPRHKKPHSASTRVGNALRMAALALQHSDTALGAYYRHTAQRRGADIADFASARKIGVLIYRLLRWGQPYIDEGAQAYEKRYQQQQIKRLTAKAKTLGYQLIPATA